MRKKSFIQTLGYSLLAAAALPLGIGQMSAQNAPSKFFRVAAPKGSEAVSSFEKDGKLLWTGTQGVTYSIQTSTDLVNWVDYTQVVSGSTQNSTPLVSFNAPSGMTLVPAGTFTMGDNFAASPSTALTVVTVSAFYLDKTLVTYQKWQDTYTYATAHGYSFVNAGEGVTQDPQGVTQVNHPVTSINWFDSVKWINARSEQEGLTPVYYTDAALTQVYKTGDTGTVVYPNWTANGYRLPTEAEWEKAARGGLIGKRFPWGDIIDETKANYSADPITLDPDYGYDYDHASFTGNDPKITALTNKDFSTSPVDYYAANGYGLRDMSGNLLQWCWDWYSTTYGQPTNVDPTGPTATPAGSPKRILRGGSWSHDPSWSRSAARFIYITPKTAANYVGFRCVRKY